MFYRLRNAFHYWSFKRQTRKLYESPPTPCHPDASCTIHTMLSAADTPLYLMAIKSMLRFGGEFAVTIHDDGSLDRECQALLCRHVPGCRFVLAAEANDRADRVLGKGSFLHQWRGLDASYRRVVDTEIWSTSPKRIIMDSDILVLSAPQEVIDWAGRGEAPFLMGQPPVPPNIAGPENVQTIFKEKVVELGAALGLPATFLDGTTSAFYGCTDQLSLEKIERLIRAGLELGIPMKTWGCEQCTVIYLLSAAGATRLNPTKYFNFFPSCAAKLPNASLVHFFGTFRWHENLYPSLASEIAKRLTSAPSSQLVV